jgi:hypothetical protein
VNAILKLRQRYALVNVVTLVLGATVATTASAQSQPAAFDTARGTVTGSTRRIGLGGAFVAIADDTEGVAINPASDAVRLPYSWDAFDYGLGIDVAVGGWLPKNDIYNQPRSGNTSTSTALFGSLAAVINYNQAGLGISAEAQRNAASRQDQTQGISTNLAANFGMLHASLAYGFLDGQLLLGAGTRLVGLSFAGGSNSGPLTAGVGYEAGVIVKPIVTQYRIAAAMKSPIDASVSGSPGAAPSTAHVPWELALGFAYQFGARPLNPAFLTAAEHARRTRPGGEPSKAEIKQAEDELFENYEKRERWYLLVSSELSLIEGGGHVGLSGEAAKARPIISPRLGLESEVVQRILKLRAGSYYEPALVAEARSRIHGTGGFDVRLFEWDVFGLVRPFDYWQLSVGADGARNYLNTSFSIGFWH